MEGVKARHLRGAKNAPKVTLKEEYRQMCMDEHRLRLKLERDNKALQTTVAECKRDLHEKTSKYENLKEKLDKLSKINRDLTLSRGELRKENRALVKKQVANQVTYGLYYVMIISALVHLVLVLL